MSAPAPTLEAFFTERLGRQRRASPHTIAAYRDTFRLLLAFASQAAGRPPSNLHLEDLDAALVAAFLASPDPSSSTTPRRASMTRRAASNSFRRAPTSRDPSSSR